MKAVVITGGWGGRGEGFSGKEIVLTPIAGRSLLFRVLESLRRAGITEVVIVSDLPRDLLEQSIGGSIRGLTLYYADPPRSGYSEINSISAIEDLVGGDFLLCIGDRLFDSRIVENLIACERRGIIVMAVDDGGKGGGLGPKVLVRDGKVLDVGEDIESGHIAVGVMLCSPKVFEFVRKAAESGGKSIADCLKLIAKSGGVYALPISVIPSYLSKLRKHARPFWVVVDTAERVREAERMLIGYSSKEPSDLVAKYLNKPIEDRLALLLARTGITPNQVTLIVNLVAYAVTFLFLSGHLIAGSLLAFLVGILDGVDGKLARLRHQESRIGSMEHPFDMLFEFSWYVALGLYTHWVIGGTLPLVLSITIIYAIAFYRFVYDQFRKATGVSLDDYSRFERIFRRIAGRRNLYNIPILAFSIVGLPLYALVAISCHAVLTAIIYAWRACKHLRALDRGEG